MLSPVFLIHIHCPLSGSLREGGAGWGVGVPLTEFVADTLVFDEGGVLEGVPAVENLRVVGERGNAAQRQDHLVGQKRSGPFTQPGDDRPVPAVLWVAQDQNPFFLSVFT